MTKLNALDELCDTPHTFLNVPHTHDATGARAAILGIPFDCGLHPFRIGSRQGPQSIRDQSRLMRTYNSELADFNPMARLKLVDCGNVRVTPSKVQESFAAIEKAVSIILKQGAVPVTMGGDGSVSLPQLRAVGKHHPDLAVIHIDSHTDTNTFQPGNEYNAGTQFTHAALEGCLDPHSSFHIGIRGTTYSQHILAHARSFGYRIVTLNALLDQGISNVVAELREQLKGRPVYLCFDMDVIDPSCAPGVAAPSWGGLTAREAIALLRMLEGFNLVAVDFNTVSPPHDINGMTASLAAALMFECLVLLCRQFDLAYPDPVPEFHY
ncbi:agmatinase [Pusillimonas sp. SM2304]|uniref:agmatinase n=1 Tax=Pusillimonas sp. SM2304 TaxID=3073241 RepID=UPI002874595C|nr:agmatinase [Pusillimonas sp. SM2304]MDS1138974.1 agmatinase [Pusillimonas sp. SM2304]